jgi:hypothetical protein
MVRDKLWGVLEGHNSFLGRGMTEEVAEKGGFSGTGSPTQKD